MRNTGKCNIHGNGLSVIPLFNAQTQRKSMYGETFYSHHKAQRQVLIKKFLNKYQKNPKISDTLNFIVITLKVEQDGVSLE